MPESYRERLESYLSAMLCVKRIHSLWHSPHKPAPKWYNIPQKYAITSSSIYRHNGLLSAAEYGNMSGAKEATA